MASSLELSLSANLPGQPATSYPLFSLTLSGFALMVADAEIGTGKTAGATLSSTVVTNDDGSVTITESVALTDSLPFLPSSYNLDLGSKTFAKGLEAQLATALSATVNGTSGTVTLAVVQS